MNALTQNGPTYAVIFRTHFWDEFAQRQLQRLKAHVGRGVVFVLVDDTNGRVEGINHDRVVRLTESDVLAMGYPALGSGNLLWFNGDYPLYFFAKHHGSFDYYLQLEYDVVVNTDVDALVDHAFREEVDFVGLTKGEPVLEWAWRHTCEGVYEPDELQYKLICLSLFSRRGLERLAARRLDLAAQVQAKAITNWPFCEGFIATEMLRDGYRSAELSNYVETAVYDSWPPFIEADLPELGSHSVIHPVLDQERYIASLLKYKIGLVGYINPNSLFHRKLRRLSRGDYFNTLARSFWQKAQRTLRSRRLLPSH